RAGDPETAWAVLRAGGLLPLGTPGRCAVDDATVRATALADAACAVRAGDRLTAESVDLEIGGSRLTGVLRELWPGVRGAVRDTRGARLPAAQRGWRATGAQRVDRPAPLGRRRQPGMLPAGR